jgi:hypothetical protein
MAFLGLNSINWGIKTGSIIVAVFIIVGLILFMIILIGIIWWKSFDRKILVFDRRPERTNKFITYNARIIKESGVFKWQLMFNGFKKIPAPTNRKYLHQMNGSQTRLMEQLADNTFVDLEISGSDPAILRQVPNENYLQWDYMERKRSQEKNMNKNNLIAILGVAVAAIGLVALIIFFVMYANHFSKIIDNIKSGADATIQAYKCVQSMPPLNATNVGVPP